MLTAIPVEELERRLSPVNYGKGVYVFVFRDEEWDVLRADTDHMSQSGTFSCYAAKEITGRSEYRFGIEQMGGRAFPHYEMIFAVTHGVRETMAFVEKMDEIEAAYREDIRGPLLKMHTAMAVLQASIADD